MARLNEGFSARHILGVAVFLLIAIPACSVLQDESGTLGDKCKNNDDCSYGEVCTTYGLDCSPESGDCSPVSICVPESCYNSRDCVNKEELKCCSGECVDMDDPCQPSCESNDDCGLGVCVLGACVDLSAIPGLTDQSCETDEDCSEGESCILGYCVDQGQINGDECVQDQDCERDNAVCFLGRCWGGNDPTPCTSDEDCRPDQICRDGECGGGFYEICKSDNDCGEDMVCLGGRCLPPDTRTCETNEECYEGELCLAGYCVGGIPQENRCEDDYDCSPGQECILGFCTTRCQSDADCTGGDSCVLGTCIGLPSPGARCNTSEDCDGGFCIAGRCWGGGPQSCRTNSDCPPGQECIMQQCREI